MDIKQDEFEDRKQIEPIPGQMCYDELLLPNYEEEKVEKDISVAVGQMDLWSLPKQKAITKQVIEDEMTICEKTEKSELCELENKIESEEKIEEKTDELPQEKVQEKSSFEVEEKTGIRTDEPLQEKSKFYDNEGEEKIDDRSFDCEPDTVLLNEVEEAWQALAQDDKEVEKLTDNNNLKGETPDEKPQEIDTEKSEVATEKNDDFEKENFAFQAPKKLRKTSILQNNFVKEKTESIEEYLHIEEEQDLTFEEEKKHFESYEEMTINFENPPKKHEKEEINASKSHFFGNYENPFED